MEGPEITQYLRELESDSRALMDEINEILWGMRGGIERESAWRMSRVERMSALKKMQKNVEITKSSGMPII